MKLLGKLCLVKSRLMWGRAGGTRQPKVLEELQSDTSFLAGNRTTQVRVLNWGDLGQ